MQGRGFYPGAGPFIKPLALLSPPPRVAAAPVEPPAAPTPELLAAAESVEWTVPTRRGAGLRNRGNTCFLNATLQALTHTPALARIALHQLHTRGCHGVSCALCVLFNQIEKGLTVGGTSDLSPDEILSHMQHFARSLTRGRQEDAHELLRLTLEALHHAGLHSVGCPTYGPKAAPSMRDRTVVERVFGGMLCSAVTCRSCGAVSKTHDTFEDLSLELQGGIQSLDEALAAFTRTERLGAANDEANKYRCESCKQLTVADKRIMVSKAPSVLVLHLKRFSALGGKINRPVAFEELLSLQPHMSEPDPGAQYSLYSVVVHDGFSVTCGHYYAFARDAHGDWWCYNDSYVTPASLQTVLKTTGAYILFYQRLHPPLPLPPRVPLSAAVPVLSPAASLKRKRALFPEALAAAKKQLIAASDGPVAALDARLRASGLVPTLRDRLRLVCSQLPEHATADDIVQAWRAEGHRKRACAAIGSHAQDEAKGVVKRAIGELHRQLACLAA